MGRPSLHALPGFVAAARTGNLSRAAESLHLTVSALSHQIRGLEERMGRRLFVRNARGVTLTADGRQLFDRVAPHFDALELAMRPYRARRDEVLTLTLMPSFAASWLVPRLPRFLAAHPQLEINLQSSTAVVDFDREPGVDAGLRFGPGRWPGVHAVHLMDDWVTPTASPALLARLGRPTLRTLDRFPLLGAPGGRWSEWFAHFGGRLPKRFVATFDDSDTLHRAAAEGLGIALGRMTLVRPLVEAGRLEALFDERLKAEFAHYLVYPPRSEGHAGLAALRAWLLEEARTDSAVPAPAPSPLPTRRRRR
ncbi:MAG TPA: LysR substrate-binding domain-containing protein [Xanthomonadaceae bacterium]|nr:LysR substrate-binding domain-containing protein [Xanthomonadaceae bacterium]